LNLSTDKPFDVMETFAASAPLELQYFMRAYEFLFAAAAIWRNRPIPNSMMAPTLNLECHAIELVLKGNLLLQKIDQKAVEKFGHSIARLWQHEKNEDLRKVALGLEQVWTGPNGNLVEKTVMKLAKVYSPGKGEFPLRYRTEPQAEAPVPNLTISIFMSLSRMGIETAIQNLRFSAAATTGRDEFIQRIKDSYYFNTELAKLL
jgi:hypothetical protein